MNANVMMWLAIAGLVVLSLVMRYVIRKVFNKAGDVLQNKLADRQNAKNNNREENLSDRYK